MLKIKNTKHLDTAEEIFTEFLDKFQKYAAEAAEISKGKGNLSPADKLKALECLETRYAALSNFFTGRNVKRRAARIWSVASFTSRATSTRDIERR